MPPPPRTPNPPPALGPRGNRPSVLSPSYSRRAYPVATSAASASAAASAGGDQDAAVSEHPCIELFEWWLARVEGDDNKIAVGGSYERNQAILELAPAAIAKRHEACVVETEEGIVLILSDSFDVSVTIANGFSSKVCENFMIGFPSWWEMCNQLYPKETSASNSNVDSTRFYLEKFQLGQRFRSHGESLLNKLSKSVKRYPRNDAAFQKSLHLPNGAPRFEEYTGDGDIAMNENAAASNDDGGRHEAACNEVYNVDMHMTAGRALRERNGGDIDTNASSVLTVECPNDADNEEADNATPTSTCDQRKAQHVDRTLTERDDGDNGINASLVLTMECTNDASNEGADNAPSTSDQRTPVISLKTQGCWKTTGHVALNNKAAVDEEMPTSVCLDVKNSSCLSNETPRLEKNTCISDTPTNEGAAALNDNSERCTFLHEDIVGSITREKGHDAAATNVSLTPTVERTADAVNEGVDNTSLLGAAALNDTGERCTFLPEEVNRIETSFVVGSITRERGHDDVATNVSLTPTDVSLTPTVECTNDVVNEGLDNTSLLGSKTTAVASLKSQGCQEKHQHIPSNQKPSDPPKKQRSALQKLRGATRSPLTSPVPYAHDSPLTRGRATSLSMSTPESLKLRKTRSGRVVVPTLDKGCQRIVYDTDGAIVGIAGLDTPSPKGTTSARKKKKAEPAAAASSKLKTYSRRKKRRAE